ncbi:uncharacterized protein LOC114537881 [Dendronephthya gigantea]|uniref:uncharacterized protein LOC114537881 n=1 Tax=Dendronephthya gigantea TaxID=151771 RepID=UPI00106D41C3|nr:uncharacterized protein LOC114537881 [Dendronephthya gigantea]
MFGEDTYKQCKTLVLHGNDDLSCVSEEDLESAIQLQHHKKLPSYKLVGDNIDTMIHARIQTQKLHENRSIHWTQQYGILNRVNEPSLDRSRPQKPLQEIQLIKLLPGKYVQENLKTRWAALVARVICKYLGKFKHLKRALVYHIQHKYSKEMADKSETCCLGIQFANSNVASEMVQLLQTNHERYVPAIKCEDGNIILEQVPLHGYQLFEERSRNAKWSMQDGDTEWDRLDGIETEFADWHAKLNLYMIEFSIFSSHSSVNEIGTSRASMNRTGKINASKGVENNYNEYKEFHLCETEAHICASFMEMCGMLNMEDHPTFDVPDDSVTREIQRKWLMETCAKFVDKIEK